jgi:hypothetical protein
MIINFRVHEISRDAHNLVRTSIINNNNKKKKYVLVQAEN